MLRLLNESISAPLSPELRSLADVCAMNFNQLLLGNSGKLVLTLSATVASSCGQNLVPAQGGLQLDYFETSQNLKCRWQPHLVRCIWIERGDKKNFFFLLFIWTIHRKDTDLRVGQATDRSVILMENATYAKKNIINSLQEAERRVMHLLCFIKSC